MKIRLLVIFFLLLLTNYGYSQNIVRKIDLYIIPVRTMFKIRVPPNKVRKYATLKMTLRESKGKIENSDFLGYIKNLNDTSSTEITEDYRIVCVVRKLIGKEVLYFNQFGDFMYKGKTYKDDRIKSFVFGHLPEYAK
ncbi:MAG: hypothetical protein KatS3mg035_2272 [Bacteroidia bacterium]|nr:MAG: hypothetical protein KatS3mg035_2041 [Bacteroidia bacterium]GIV45149.1 MAG: hypothetical protein KatS3mg035_2272 [Bacteroidia bacterium]